MKVIMTADTVGGVWTYAMELIRALGAHDVEVGLATMGAPLSKDQRETAEGLGNLTLFESAYRLEWMEDPWEDVEAAGRWLLEKAAAFEPDVVHLNGYSHGARAWSAPVLIVGHSCVVSWWRAVHGEDPPRSWDRYRASVRRGLAGADAVAAPTKAMGDSLREIYGVRAEVRVIPNGRRAGTFPPGAKHPYVMSAGRLWDEAKNLSVLDEAAAGLSWPVYVAGPQEDPDGRERAKSRHARPLGRLTPREMAGWVGKADVYCLPAKYEPFGLSILEAALARCALVLGDVPSLREVWADAAVFVPPDDADALREALREVIRTPRARRELAEAARDRAMRFSPEAMARAYRATYDELRADDAGADAARATIAGGAA